MSRGARPTARLCPVNVRSSNSGVAAATTTAPVFAVTVAPAPEVVTLPPDGATPPGDSDIVNWSAAARRDPLSAFTRRRVVGKTGNTIGVTVAASPFAVAGKVVPSVDVSVTYAPAPAALLVAVLFLVNPVADAGYVTSTPMTMVHDSPNARKAVAGEASSVLMPVPVNALFTVHAGEGPVIDRTLR